MEGALGLAMGQLRLWIAEAHPSQCRNQGAVHGLRCKGARHSLQRCSKQGAVHVASCAGLLYAEPEEGGIVGRSELKADAAIDHRYGIRVQGEGCEGAQV